MLYLAPNRSEAEVEELQGAASNARSDYDGLEEDTEPGGVFVCVLLYKNLLYAKLVFTQNAKMPVL